MKYLVDSNTVIDFFNGKTEFFNLFDDTENIFISAISVGELFSKAKENSNDDYKLKICKDFCDFLNILPVTQTTAEIFAFLKGKYTSVAQDILWFCAVAIEKDLIIISSNPHLEQIKEVVQKKL